MLDRERSSKTLGREYFSIDKLRSLVEKISFHPRSRWLLFYSRFSFNGILTERSFNLETIARSVNSVTSNFVERNRWNGNRPVNVLINRPSRTAVNLAPCMQFTIILRNLPWETGQGNWPLAIEKLVGSSNLRVFGRKFRLKGKKKKE